MKHRFILFFSLLSFVTTIILAQNPLITDQFTADPSARVFEGKVYVYPSHDVPCGPGQGFIGFCMPDYHVFSSENLVDWEDHGVIVSQKTVEWVDSSRYSLWAPDCIEKDGKYYFYFPATGKDTALHRGMRVGVAVADHPYGPFMPESVPMDKVWGIDPNPFIDKDGQAYLYWAGHGSMYGAKLSADMRSIVGEPQAIQALPKGFKEGPYLFEREGIYYFTYPTVRNKTEELAYAIGDNPMGPFEYKGIIMDESPVGCWTNHHSILEYKGQWYLFYHHNDLSPHFDKNRSIRVDSLFFDKDGAIQPVTPTWRGVGITRLNQEIQIDRYSEISKKGVNLEFLDSLQPQLGWCIQFEKEGAWLRYNRVDFGTNDLQKISIRGQSNAICTLEIHIDGLDGPLISSIQVAAGSSWDVYAASLQTVPAGIHDLFVVLKSRDEVKLDWIRFE